MLLRLETHLNLFTNEATPCFRKPNCQRFPPPRSLPPVTQHHPIHDDFRELTH